MTDAGKPVADMFKAFNAVLNCHQRKHTKEDMNDSLDRFMDAFDRLGLEAQLVAYMLCLRMDVGLKIISTRRFIKWAWENVEHFRD